MKKKVEVIGSGFASIAADCYLAKEGYEVTVYEKNAQLGGRARQFVNQGFKFDMGPTWYWMPDVFERFFGDFQFWAPSWKQINGPAFEGLTTLPDRTLGADRFCSGTQGCAEIHNGLGVICSPFLRQQLLGCSPELLMNLGFSGPAVDGQVPCKHAFYIAIKNYGRLVMCL